MSKIPQMRNERKSKGTYQAHHSAVTRMDPSRQSYTSDEASDETVSLLQQRSSTNRSSDLEHGTASSPASSSSSSLPSTHTTTINKTNENNKNNELDDDDDNDDDDDDEDLATCGACEYNTHVVSLILLSGSFFCLFAPFSAIQNLESSLNASDKLGATAIATLYLVYVCLKNDLQFFFFFLLSLFAVIIIVFQVCN